MHFENVFFFQSLGNVFAVSVDSGFGGVFAQCSGGFTHSVGHDVLCKILLTFLPKEKFGYVVLQHPRLFAFMFTVMILVVSILRANTLLRVEFLANAMLAILLLSVPQGVLEGYAIFLAIDKTLEKNMAKKNLITIRFSS